VIKAGKPAGAAGCSSSIVTSSVTGAMDVSRYSMASPWEISGGCRRAELVPVPQ
jgi:hypothetical protein